MLISLICFAAYRIFGPKMAKFILLVALLVIVTFPIYYVFLQSPPPLPKPDASAFWGPKELKGKPDKSIKPFEISYDEEMLTDLKDKLKRSREYTPALEGTGFEYGFNSAQVQPWAKYWAEEYNFEERLKFLNQFPQFKTLINGLNIHFIRVTPKVPAGVEVVPLLLLHGWPGSVREFYEAIPLLTAVTKDRDFAIEVIAPSLPGYGYSDAAARPGLGANEMAVVFRNLMKRLGFKRYYVQGGDWGAFIGSSMVTQFPEEALGFHTNMGFVNTIKATIYELVGSLYPPLIVDSKLADRMYPLSTKYATFLEEFGYMHIQATKPDTVGFALSDSPTGLLVYILEKFSTWTNKNFRQKPDGGLTARFTKEQLIDNLMMYWPTKAIITSMRLYAETFNSRHLGARLEEIPTPVPTWVIQAKYELAYQPPAILKLKFPNLVQTTVLDDGGHFLALELPKVFSEDVIKAVAAFRKLAKTRTEL